MFCRRKTSILQERCCLLFVIISCQCCGHPVACMMRREGRYSEADWARGETEVPMTLGHHHGPARLPHTTQSRHHSLQDSSRLHQDCIMMTDLQTSNTPVLSLQAAATNNQSEAGGLWLMVRPGYLPMGALIRYLVQAQ